MLRVISNIRFQSAAVALALLLVAGCGGGGGSSSGSAPAAVSSSSSSAATSSSSSSSSAFAVADYPELALTTDGGAAITDKNTYVTGNLSLPATADAPAFSGRMSIKLHGNSTLMFDKKPYRIKLDEKAKLLGMPKDKNWVLLANYSDKTLLRNRTALELGRRMNMAWTPRVQPVEVTLNGAYIGLYDLVEQVRVADDRVAITETEDTTAPEDAGYLMEIDERMDEAVCWRTSRNVPLCLKYPIPALTGNKPTSGPMSRRQRTVCSAPIRPML